MKRQSNPPISVLRKSGSSRCLQNDFLKKCNSNEKDESYENSRTVTLINTDHLPSFGTERYYMLSEIQMKAHSIQFLCDLVGTPANMDDDDDSDAKTQDMSVSSHSLSNDDLISNNVIKKDEHPINYERIERRNNDNHDEQTIHRTKYDLPPSVILYLLWRPDCMYDTPSLYAEHVIKPSVQHLMNLYDCVPTENNQDAQINEGSGSINNNTKKLPLIYIVVDRVIIPHLMDQIKEDVNDEEEILLQQQKQNEAKKKVQLDIAEALIRKVSTDHQLKLRSIIKGITVGISDSIRAAPGLEVCMDAIVVGDSERRRFYAKKQKMSSFTKLTSSHDDMESTLNNDDTIWTMNQPNRSSIGVITEYPDDLIGLDPNQETDAAQIDLNFHIRCSGVWEGNGNVMNFALLSQQIWRKYWNDSGNLQDDDSDDFLLLMYSIIMGTNGKKRNRRTGRRRSRNKAHSGKIEDEKSLQSKYLPCMTEQQNVERAANIMIFMVILMIGYFNMSTIIAIFDTLNSQIKLVVRTPEL